MGEQNYGRRTKSELLADGIGQRQHGDGALFQTEIHGKKVWRAAKIITGLDGKRVKVQGTGQTAADARDRLQRNINKRLTTQELRAKAALPRKTGPIGPNPTFLEVAADWLELRSTQGAIAEGKGVLRPQTANSYRYILKNHLFHWGNRPIRDYTKEEVRHLFYRVLTQDYGIGNSHLRSIQGVVRQVFYHAVEWGYIEASPAASFRLVPRDKAARLSKVKTENLESLTWITDRIMGYLAPGKTEKDFLDRNGNVDQERWKAWQHHSQFEARWGLACILGLRPSEILGLTWPKITYLDNDAGVGREKPRLVIEQQLARDPNSLNSQSKLYISLNPKTESGVRALPLSQELVEMLRRWKKIQAKWRKDSANWAPYLHSNMDKLVFTTKTGKPRKQQTDSQEWRNLLEQVFRGTDQESARIRQLRQYSMRHICLTRLLKEGTPIAIVSSIAGHSSVSLTASVYGHLSLDDKAPWIDAVSKKTMREVERAKTNKTA